MKTVAVIEGFSGGPKHTAGFRTALRKAGFKVTNNYRQADIIVAHSAGIYAIPTNAKASLLILIGPTYWPGELLLKRTLRFTKSARQYYVSNHGWAFYIKKKLLEVYYFFTRHKYLWLGILHNNRLDRLQKLAESENRKIIIVRNQEDTYATPRLGELFEDYANVKYVELPGIHDDYTVNHEPYIKLLKDTTR